MAATFSSRQLYSLKYSLKLFRIMQLFPSTLRRFVTLSIQNYIVALVLIFALSILFLPCVLVYGVGVLLVASHVAQNIENWRPRTWLSSHNKAVFITGCGGGFGYLLARRLHDLGLEVFAGCRSLEGEGVKALKKLSSDRLHVIPLDVTSEESVQKAAKYVFEHLGTKKLWAVVNNAGVNAGAELMWTSLSTAKSIFEVNTIGSMRVTKAFLPMLCHTQGRVVNVSSTSGRYTFPGLVSYCMSKHAITSFSDGLRIEVARFGVKIITIEPWIYKTRFSSQETVLKYVMKAWEESPSEVKNLYPKNYINRYKRVVTKFLQGYVSKNPQEVVDTMVEAVLAKDPKYSYMLGKLLPRIALWLFVRLPKPIVDAYIHFDMAYSMK